MASMPPPPPGRPPGNPPGNPPYGAPQYGPPYGDPRQYDPRQYNNTRDYWRYQKDQNKAAWRAQRDAWRAQRNAYRAQTRAMRVPSVAGPILLIGAGVVALLVLSGHIAADQFWNWLGHWWPMLLIGLGLIALAEWAIDLRRQNPPSRRFGGLVWLVVILVLVCGSANGMHSLWGPLRAQFGDNGDDFFNALGQPEHDLDQPEVTTAIPANAQIEIQDPRGDVSITAGDDAQIGVRAHQVAYAESDSSAAKVFDSQKPQVTVSGNAVLVKIDANSSGRTNLNIMVPRSASVNVNAGHGDVTVAGLGGNVDAQMQHGDMQATSIAGHVHASLANNGDFSAHDVQGDVTLEGDGGDLTLSDVHGKVTLQGEYSGDIHLERADQQVSFHSSRTNIELGRLPGDMSMSMDSLHITQVAGPVRIVTHSRDIEMNQVYGDTHIEDRDADVQLNMAGSFPVEVKNNKGDVEVALPPNANVWVDARTENGDIVSDFPLATNGDENKTASGNIGKGGPKVVLSTEHADLHLRKGEDAPPLPALQSKPAIAAKPAVAAKAAALNSAGPASPPSSSAPHLKTMKGAAEQTVTQ